MPLPSLTQRAELSRLTLKLVKNSKGFSLENDTISRGSLALCNRRHRHTLSVRRYSQRPAATTTTAAESFTTPFKLSSTSSSSSFTSASFLTSVGRHVLSTLHHRPLPSPLSRSVSYLRPLSIDHLEEEPNIRLLDDVSLHFFQLLFTPEFCFLTEMIASRGYEIRIVGK